MGRVPIEHSVTKYGVTVRILSSWKIRHYAPEIRRKALECVRREVEKELDEWCLLRNSGASAAVSEPTTVSGERAIRFGVCDAAATFAGLAKNHEGPGYKRSCQANWTKQPGTHRGR